MPDKKPAVGAGLLANMVFQSQHLWLTQRIGEQARLPTKATLVLVLIII
jgi:hypothetical protein